ncbi:MAG: serine/threonine protein kinase [Deltaproteobacteria bacterium]|nr:serine/threonine protein kinase [Deltaproteobacteria bacterium]
MHIEDLQSGELIGERFRLEEKIGEGGMASVWRATDQTLNRHVAVKFLYIRDIRQHDNMIRAFLREARLAAAIRHRNVVDILDFGTHSNGLPFMVMELLEGESMEDRLFREEKFSLEEILSIIARVLQGLMAVHDAGIVHRDIKPANIFLVKERIGFFPKLLDFGISRSTEPDSGRESALTTQDGRIVGTLEYMSSEQARGQTDIDIRTDIYSIGVILYELLTGRLPFESEHQGDLIVQIMTSKPPTVFELRPEVGKPLSDLVEKATHRDRERRFATAEEMHDALIQIAEQTFGPHIARAISLPPLARPGKVPAKTQQLIFSKSPGPQPAEKQNLKRGSPVTLSATESITEPKSRKTWLPWIIGGGAVIVLSAAAVTLGSLKSRLETAEPGPRYIVVQGGSQPATQKPHKPLASNPIEAAPSERITAEKEPVADNDVAPQAQAERVAEAKQEAKPARKSPPKTVSPESQAVALARRFSAQKAGVIKCFSESEIEISEASHLSVRIELGTDGLVRSAQVSPPSIADTSTGECIVQATKEINFGPQPEPISFRVPLTARRGR